MFNALRIDEDSGAGYYAILLYANIRISLSCSLSISIFKFPIFRAVVSYTVTIPKQLLCNIGNSKIRILLYNEVGKTSSVGGL